MMEQQNVEDRDVLYISNTTRFSKGYLCVCIFCLEIVYMSGREHIVLNMNETTKFRMIRAGKS